MTRVKIALLTTCAALGGMIVGSVAPAQAQLGGLFRGVGAAVIVEKFGGQINSFVNTVTGNKTSGASGEATKVVPILSIGQGTYVGAVQVSGPQDLVNQVQAVGQLAAKKKIGTDVQVTALIPVANKDAASLASIGSISRVKGVGVSAIIDIKL